MGRNHRRDRDGCHWFTYPLEAAVLPDDSRTTHGWFFSRKQVYYHSYRIMHRLIIWCTVLFFLNEGKVIEWRLYDFQLFISPQLTLTRFIIDLFSVQCASYRRVIKWWRRRKQQKRRNYRLIFYDGHLDSVIYGGKWHHNSLSCERWPIPLTICLPVYPTYRCTLLIVTIDSTHT